MRLESFIHADRVLVLENATDRDEVLRLLAAAASPAIGDVDEEQLLEALQERESQMATSTPEAVGFPHALLPEIDSTIVVVALLRKGVDFGSPNHPPVTLIFGMFGSSEKPWEHVRLLARLARIARAPGALDKLRAAADARALFEALVEEDRSHG